MPKAKQLRCCSSCKLACCFCWIWMTCSRAVGKVWWILVVSTDCVIIGWSPRLWGRLWPWTFGVWRIVDDDSRYKRALLNPITRAASRQRTVLRGRSLQVDFPNSTPHLGIAMKGDWRFTGIYVSSLFVPSLSYKMIGLLGQRIQASDEAWDYQWSFSDVSKSCQMRS